MTPGELKLLINQMQIDLAKLLAEYRWLYNAAYGQQGRSLERGSSGVSKPTEATLESVQRSAWRNKLVDCDRKIRHVASELNKAAAIVTTGYRFKDVLSDKDFPVAATKTEIEKLREAQSRREERGESFGEG